MSQRRTFARAGGVLALLATLVPCASRAQIAPIPAVNPPARAAAPWQKLRTEHFEFDYRKEFAAWTAATAAQMEAVRTAVRDRVGYAPSRRVTVVVDDPQNESNGEAIAWLDHPQIRLFPVPPSPRSQLGNDRDWGELLVVHEYAHIAHLTRPSRTPSFLRRYVPLLFSTTSLEQETPRWVDEGYATLIEGALTGSGRPSSVLRASILRTFAADGVLPSYDGMNGTSGFMTGSFAYLMGSAYLEYLAATHGDSTIPQLWRRLTARTPRSFDYAFAATFGVGPDEAYARYTARLTANALAIEAALDSAGRIEGTLDVANNQALGDPAVSRDGKEAAMAFPGSDNGPGQILVWSTTVTPEKERDSVRRADATRLLKFDSLDVPPVPQRPGIEHIVATLHPAHGFSYRVPRFMANSDHILVIRSEVRADGSVFPDLYEWNTKTDRVRRITNGAAVREADPFPDNTRAVGTRCIDGRCDLVIVTLRDGAVRVLRAGSVSVEYARPRVSPDGTHIVASEHKDGRWHAVLIDPASGNVTPVGPDDGVNRYDLAWTHDGRSLLGVTEASGIPNIERIDIASGNTTSLSRVFSAAMAPEPLPGDSVAFMLTLTSRGYDLRRLSLTDTTAARALPLATTAFLSDLHQGAVVWQPAIAARPFATTTLSPPRSYGIGPQRVDWMPVGGAGIGGAFLGLAVYGSDPIDRFSWHAEQVWKTNARTSSGTVGRVAFRLPRITVDAEASRARLLGARWTGGAIAVSRSRWDTRGLTGARAGVAYHHVDHSTNDGGGATDSRKHVWVSLNRTLEFGRVARTLLFDVRGQYSRSTGVTADDGATTHADHRVGMVSMELNSETGPGVRWEVSAGESSPNVPSERFALGGLGSRTIDPSVVPQNIAVPWLSPGELSGRRFVRHVVRLPLPVVQPSAWAVRTDHGEWQRALGLESTEELPPNGFDRIPGISMTGGLAYLFSSPHRDRVRAWIGFSLR